MDFLINTIDARNKIVQYIYRLPIETRPYKAKIVPVKMDRTDKQNRYMWYTFELIAQETGSDKETIKNFFSTLFLQVSHSVAGREFQTVRGTSTLSTSEHNELMENVRIWCAAELGIVVPLPDEIILED